MKCVSLELIKNLFKGDASSEDDVSPSARPRRPLCVRDGEEQHGAPAEAERDDAVSVHVDIDTRAVYSL